ncbi:MAG: NAD(P)/FAD-dependent oxidoreductase [Variibacter sp.]
MNNSRSDVIIVGGGIVGCATAYYLARRNVRVTLIERGKIAGEQSSRAWGFVRQQGRHSAEMPLAAEANSVWPHLAKELQADLEFVQGGIMQIAETAADEASLEEAMKTAQGHGLSTRLVTPREIAKILPELSGKWRSGLYTEADGHAEPMKATRAFADAAERLGARIIANTPVTAIDVTAGVAAGAITRTGRHEAGKILLACGAGARYVARTAGVDLPIQLVRSSVGQTNPAPKPFTRTAVWSPKVAFRPKLDGSFYLGSGYRGVGADYEINIESFRHMRQFVPAYRKRWRQLKLGLGRSMFQRLGPDPVPEPPVNLKKVSHNEQRFYELFPQLGKLGLARSWSGMIDLTPDLIPYVGATGPANFYVAAGFSGHGFALGPVMGRLLTDLMLEGKCAFDLSAFSPTRFR